MSGREFPALMCCRLGYNLLYLSSVARPGDQINRSVDTRQIATDVNFNPPAQPLGPFFSFRTTDYWVQGFTIGVAFQF